MGYGGFSTRSFSLADVIETAIRRRGKQTAFIFLPGAYELFYKLTKDEFKPQTHGAYGTIDSPHVESPFYQCITFTEAEELKRSLSKIEITAHIVASIDDKKNDKWTNLS